jgi:hypothetical protein
MSCWKTSFPTFFILKLLTQMKSRILLPGTVMGYLREGKSADVLVDPKIKYKGERA